MNKLKAIQHILDQGDVRDMRSTLAAIEMIMAKPEDPVLTINVFDDETSAGPMKVRVELKYDAIGIEDKHIDAAVTSLGDLFNEGHE